MNVAPRYLGRGSWLARRDPRVLLVSLALFVFTVVQVWDLRILAGLALVAYLYYRSAGIEWATIRRNWAFVFVFIGLLVSVNLFVFSDGFVEGLPPGDGHLLFTVPLLGTPVTAESLSLAVTQFTRYLTMATIGFPVAFAIAPSDFGVAFRRLGVPEKFAFGLDLTFRFLPSLAADFQTTVDAQRIRGFDWSGGAAGFLSRVRRSTPVVVPTVVNAIAGAEDTIDAMDLRAFGTGRRSWLRELRYDMQDRLVLLGFTALLVIISILGFMGITSKLYVFPFLLALAGA